ncbi:unnamed protein product [Closterium sp. NIES-54]
MPVAGRSGGCGGGGDAVLEMVGGGADSLGWVGKERQDRRPSKPGAGQKGVGWRVVRWGGMGCGTVGGGWRGKDAAFCLDSHLQEHAMPIPSLLSLLQHNEPIFQASLLIDRASWDILRFLSSPLRSSPSSSPVSSFPPSSPLSLPPDAPSHIPPAPADASPRCCALACQAVGEVASGAGDPREVHAALVEGLSGAIRRAALVGEGAGEGEREGGEAEGEEGEGKEEELGAAGMHRSLRKACQGLHCIALHCIALHRIASHCIALHRIALHCIALHCIALHRIASHCIALHRIALHCIASHCIALHCIALHRIASHCIALHCIYEATFERS